jgi:hypothetical protein
MALAKQNNPGIVFTHCFLHRETEVQKILDEMINMVNYLKSGLLQSKLFSALFSAMEVAHTDLLLHMELR